MKTLYYCCFFLSFLSFQSVNGQDSRILKDSLPPSDSWTIYPVPVTNFVTLQHRSKEIIQDVLTVTVTSLTSGICFLRLRLASTQRTVQIPLNNLGRGLYDISIFRKDKRIWGRRFNK